MHRLFKINSTEDKSKAEETETDPGLVNPSDDNFLPSANTYYTTSLPMAAPTAPIEVTSPVETTTISGIFDAEVTALLAEINGQDCYDAKTDAVGKLSKAYFLKIPNTFPTDLVEPGRIGLADAVEGMTTTHWAQIYYLNKSAFSKEQEPIKIKAAMLRADLVAAGWVTGTYEVQRVEEPDMQLVAAEMAKDMEAIKESKDQSKKLALLLPLAAEHVFRTMGHHYLTNLASDYSAKYQRFFAACVLTELTNYLPEELLYHRVAHWVPLDLALAVAQSVDQKPKLPNAVVLRSKAGPAGTAIITTSEAILKALAQTGLLTPLQSASGVDIKTLIVMSEKVKADPGRYHTIPTAYNKAHLPPDEEKALNDAKEMGIMLAPVLQGFLDSLPKNSQLPQAKALIKHADTNPLLRKRAKAFFKEVGTTKAPTMAELFSTQLRGEEAVAGTGIIDPDEDE